MEKLFRRARQNRIFQDVVDQIETAILENQISPGEKLPSERALCELFQTSRGTLREAMRILEQKGLVEIRLGINGGAYAKAANGDLMTDNLAMLIRSNNISLEHLSEFRENVEGTVTCLAAQRSLAADNARLDLLLIKAAKFCAEGVAGWTDFIKTDEEIHTEIARIAGNPLYTFVLHSIHQNIHRYYDKFLHVGEKEMEENLEDLHIIVKAIADKNQELAGKTASSHVRRFNGYMTGEKRQS